MSEIHSFGVEPITSHAFNATKDSKFLLIINNFPNTYNYLNNYSYL